MTPTETLAHLRALTDPTPGQLREASDLALLATGWEKRPEIVDTPFGDDQRLWFESPCGRRWRLDTGRTYPHPCASIDDAVRWMVPNPWYVERLHQLHSNEEPYEPLDLWFVVLERQMPYSMVSSSWWISGTVQEKNPYSNHMHGRHDARNPALALTIAGLSATLEGEK